MRKKSRRTFWSGLLYQINHAYNILHEYINKEQNKNDKLFLASVWWENRRAHIYVIYFYLTCQIFYIPCRITYKIQYHFLLINEQHRQSFSGGGNGDKTTYEGHMLQLYNNILERTRDRQNATSHLYSKSSHRCR